MNFKLICSFVLMSLSTHCMMHDIRPGGEFKEYYHGVKAKVERDGRLLGYYGESNPENYSALGQVYDLMDSESCIIARAIESKSAAEGRRNLQMTRCMYESKKDLANALIAIINKES